MQTLTFKFAGKTKLSMCEASSALSYTMFCFTSGYTTLCFPPQTISLPLSHTPFLSLTHTPSHTQSQSLPLSLSQTPHKLSHTHSLKLSHTHTNG